MGVKNGSANRLTFPLLHPLDSAILWLLPARQLDNPWIFCHSTDASVFFCPKRINPSLTPPPTPFLSVVTVTAASNCILTLQVTQARASRGSFWCEAQKALCHLRPECSLCLCLCAHLCMCSHAASSFRGSLTLSRSQ